MLKRTLALLLIVSVVAIMAVTSFAAAGNDLKVDVPKGTPTIDGAKDAVYTGDVMDVNFYKAGNAGATGKAWATWDDSAVYFYIEASDKTPNNTDSVSPHNNDCVEFFIVTKEIDAGVQIRIQPRLEGDAQFSGGDNTPMTKETVEWVAKTNADNTYVIEIKLPTAAVLGDQLLFDLQVGDDEKGAGRSSQAFFGSNSDAQWSGKSEYGATMTLVAAPEPTATTPAATGVASIALAVAALTTAVVIKKR